MKNRQIGIPIPKIGIPKKYFCRNSVHLILYKKNGCCHTYIYSKRLPSYLHLLNADCHHNYIYSMLVAAIPSSTQNGCRHTYIYSTPVPPYLHLLNAGCRHTYIYSKKRRERFPIHKIGRIDGRRGFQIGRNVFQIGKNTFYNQTKKLRCYFRSSKGLKLEKLRNSAEFQADFPTKTTLCWMLTFPREYS